MARIILVFCISFFIYAGSLAQTLVIQQVVGSAGGSSKAIGGYAIDFTVGEAVILTAGSNPICTQGFQQPTNASDFTHISLHLTATGLLTSIRLNWQTSAEVNNDRFYIERSADGIRFADIGSLPSSAAGGNSTTPLSYTSNDNQPFAGPNYYRIREVAKNGAILYSETALVNFQLPDWGFQVYPNPVHDILQIHGYIDQDETIGFRLFDIQGRQILVREQAFPSGYVNYSLTLGPLAHGVYVLYIAGRSNGRHQAVKLLRE